MIQTVGVYHIGIPVDDLDRAERFYTKILGMRGGHRIAEGGFEAQVWRCGCRTFSTPTSPKS